MATSRCITSFFKSPSFLTSQWSSSHLRPLQRLAETTSTTYRRKWTLCSQTIPRKTDFLTCGSQQWRCFSSQKSSDASESTQKDAKNKTTPSSSQILGSLPGLGGIAGEMLKQVKPGPDQSSSQEKSKTREEEEAEDEEKRKKEAESSWKALKYSMIFLGVSMTGMAGFLVATWGVPDRDEEGNQIVDQFSSKALPLQYLLRSWNAMMNYSQMIRDPSRDKLLPDPLREPYYQPPYTLILEMTDVLVHPDWTYQTGWRFKKRPGIDFFLSQVGPPTFEVVIYTAEQAFTAYPLLDALDPNGYIMYRLFRDATRYVDGHHVKDLDCINRDLSKVIVIDWNEKSVKSHPRNALHIKQWKGNDDDRTLVDLALLLKTIATSEVQDVREVLDFYNQFDDPVEAFRENQRKLQEQQELIERMNQEKLAQPATSVARSLFGRRF